MKNTSKLILLLPIVVFAIIIPYGIVSANDELFSSNTIQETTTEPEEPKKEEEETKSEHTIPEETKKEEEETKPEPTKSEIEDPISKKTTKDTPSPIPFFRFPGSIVIAFSLLIIALYIARKRPNAP